MAGEVLGSATVPSTSGLLQPQPHHRIPTEYGRQDRKVIFPYFVISFILPTKMMDFARFVTRKSVGLSRNSIRSFSIDELKPTAVTLKTAFRDRLEDAKKHALHGGGKKRVDAQHSKGKLTARERLDLLLDQGSFQEYDQLKTHRCTEFGMDKETYYGDGVVTGHGLIHGRKVFNEQLIGVCDSVNDLRYL